MILKKLITICQFSTKNPFSVREMDLCYSISSTGNENKLTYLYIRAFFDIFGFDLKSNNALFQLSMPVAAHLLMPFINSGKNIFKLY